MAAHGDSGATTTPPSGGKRVNLGKELGKEPGGWCHLGTKEVWVNILSFGSREGVSSCPSWCVCVRTWLSQNTAGR